MAFRADPRSGRVRTTALCRDCTAERAEPAASGLSTSSPRRTPRTTPSNSAGHNAPFEVNDERRCSVGRNVPGSFTTAAGERLECAGELQPLQTARQDEQDEQDEQRRAQVLSKEQPWQSTHLPRGCSSCSSCPSCLAVVARCGREITSAPLRGESTTARRFLIGPPGAPCSE